MIREAIREQLNEAGSGRAVNMMNQLIQSAGPQAFSQEFIARMGPEEDDNLRSILSYIAKRLEVEI